MTAASRFAYVWEYRIRRDREDDFLALYGPEGEWVQLFRRAAGFIETRLLRDADDPHRFVTFDHWESRAHRDRFRTEFADEFAGLDARGEALTSEERFLGDFELVPGKD